MILCVEMLFDYFLISGDSLHSYLFNLSSSLCISGMVIARWLVTMGTRIQFPAWDKPFKVFHRLVFSLFMHFCTYIKKFTLNVIALSLFSHIYARNPILYRNIIQNSISNLCHKNIWWTFRDFKDTLRKKSLVRICVIIKI